MFLSDETGKAS